MIKKPSFHPPLVLLGILLLVWTLACNYSAKSDTPSEPAQPKVQVESTELEEEQVEEQAAPAVESGPYNQEPLPVEEEPVDSGQDDIGSAPGSDEPPTDAMQNYAPSSDTLPPEMGKSRAVPYATYTRIIQDDWEFQIQEILRGDAAWTKIVDDWPNAEPLQPGFEYVAVRLWTSCKIVDEYSHSFGINEMFVTGSDHLVYTDQLKDVPAPELVYMDFYTAEEREGWIDAAIPVDLENLLLVLSLYDTDPLYIAVDENASIPTPVELAGIEPNDLGLDPANPVPVGSTSISPAWEVEFLDLMHGEEAWNIIQEAYSSNEPPGENMEYYMAYVRVRYIGPVDQAHYVAKDIFRLHDGTQEIKDTRIFIQLDTFDWLYGSVYPGGQLAGWVPLLGPTYQPGMMLEFIPNNEKMMLDQEYIRYLAITP